MAQGSMDSDRLSSAGISTHSSGTAGTLGGSVVGVRVGDNGHKQHEDEYNLGPLPPMWEKAFTPSGEAYFIDHSTGTSHWLDPRLARVRKRSLGECSEHELPYGWERVSDERYGCYYVDHINRRTQYENPVLQARRLRAEKMSPESGPQSPVPPSNGVPSTGELRGERFTVTLTKGTQGLGFTLIGAEGIPEAEGYLQIRSIVPHSPAWIDGALRPGDVVVGVGSRGVRGLSHAAVATIFQSIPCGSDVTLHLVRGYPLSFDSEDPNTRVLSTLAVDAAPAPSDAAAMQQLTRALRTRFNLDSPDTEPAPSEPVPSTAEQRRLLSRSFDLDELSPAQESNLVPPRCPSADHLLSIATGSPPVSGPSAGTNTGPGSGGGQELRLSLRRGAAGFGFTIADSVHGQRVKKVLDRSRCAGLREGDLLLQIGPHDVRHANHHTVVQVLKECPAQHETLLVVWRREHSARGARAPRSRSATRVSTTTAPAVLGRCKTPTAEQLRAAALQGELLQRLRGNDTVEATYAVPEHKSRERESLIERRRRSSTPGGRLTLPAVSAWTEPTDQWARDRNGNQWQNENKQENNNQWKSPDNQPTDDRNGGQWQEETWLDNSNSNVRNWAESTQKWDNNNQYTENGDKWTENGQKWTENEQKWESNGQKWESNGQKWESNGQKWESNGQKWESNGNGWEANGERWNGNWGEVSTPTVHVDMNAAYWRGNASVADSSDNGGFPEDGMPQSPTTAAVGGLVHSPEPARRAHSPNSIGLAHQPPPGSAPAVPAGSMGSQRGQSPAGQPARNGPTACTSPTRLREAASSPPHRVHSPYSAYPAPAAYPASYPQDALYPNYPIDPALYSDGSYPGYPVAAGANGAMDGHADVVVRLSRGAQGFGFRIVGGTEDGSRVAVGYVVPGGPADGLLRPGDLLTSVDGVSLVDATHARAVQAVGTAASRGHATLGIRHNRGDVRSSHRLHSPELGAGAAYSIVHPAPLYPPRPPHPLSSVQHMRYGAQYDQMANNWSTPYEVTVTRAPGEGFGFVVISSTNKAISTIGQLIPGSPAARCGLLHVGDTIVAINGVPVRTLSHPEVVTLIKRSGSSVTLTVLPSDGTVD